MTEKRFVSDVKDSEKEVRIFDLVEEKKVFNIFFNELDSAICLNGALGDVVTRLNELHEQKEILEVQLKSATNEIVKLESEINMLTDTCHDCCKEIREENQYIKNTIKDMLDNERTDLGKSVLKQLMEVIQ